MKRENPRKIRNVDLWDRPYVKNNHQSYKKDKRIVNHKIRRSVNRDILDLTEEDNMKGEGGE